MNKKHSHCRRGHPLVGDNVKLRPSRATNRSCRICEEASREKWYRLKYAENDGQYVPLNNLPDKLNRQRQKCAICRQPERRLIKNTTTPQRLTLDHDHRNGNPRGFLCANCNTGLGLFKDNAKRLRAAARYLDLYKEKSKTSKQLWLIKEDPRST